MFPRIASRLVAAALTLGLAQAAQAQELRIGALLAMSGTQATFGELMSSGALMAVEHANADRALKGKLTLLIEDTQATPQNGVIAINKLINVENVPFVLSSYSGVAKAIAPIAARAKVVAVNGGGVGPDLAELGPYFWNVIPLANTEVRAFVPYLVKQRNLKRVALLYVDDPLGQGIRKELESALPAAGGELVAALSVPVATQQFAGVAARIREAKPDVVYIASYGAQQVAAIKQLRDNGVTQTLASYGSFSNPEILALPEARGALFTTQLVDTASNDAVTKRFVDDYKAKHGKAANVYTINYYNAVRVFVLLAAELQKQGKPVTGENLLAQRNATASFDLVGAKVSFEANGTVAAPIQINEIADGAAKALTVVRSK
ncbi:MAG: branched-chain amino acid ABC transporter substrate-binding protein [Rubrivivax sp. SCN 70-15]|nr:MAG: branched-chain amino acid ABC transporter substrate-binding protein [Rubrivivax sp. SCN 70-15]